VAEPSAPPIHFSGIKIPRLRPWREFSVAALSLMELSWVVPWYRVLTPATHAISVERSYGVLGGILIFSMVSVRFMNYLRLKLRAKQWILLCLLGISSLIGVKYLLYPSEHIPISELFQRPFESINSDGVLIPDEFLIILIILVTWWRGTSLAHFKVGPQEVLSKFKLGILMLFGYIFFNTIITGESFGASVYLFLFSGLLSMGAARVSILSKLRGGKRNPFDRSWFLGLLGSCVGLVGLAFIVVAMVTGEISLVNQLIIYIWGLILAVFVIISAPFVIVVMGGFEKLLSSMEDSGWSVLDQLKESFVILQKNIIILVEFLTELIQKIGILKLLDALPNFSPFVRWALLLLVVVAVLGVIGLRIRTLYMREGLNDERQLLLNRHLLFSYLSREIENQLRRLASGISNLVNLQQGRRLLAAARIRRIYAKMMDLSNDLGTPRKEAQTPLEFLPTLGELFPVAKEDVSVVTNAYLRIRYGELPETKDEVDEVERAWVQIRREGEDIKKDQRV
jgi:hypothetical protein